MSQIDATSINKIFDLTEQIKKLENEKEGYVKQLKAAMIQSGQNEIVQNGHKIQLIHSTRNSVKKNMKNALMLFLKTKGLNGCIKVEYDVIAENINTEIVSGRLDKQELSQYMSITDVVSMRITL